MARNADEMSASLIRYADNGGLIPGACAGGYTTHVRMSATPLIVSAYNKGADAQMRPDARFPDDATQPYAGRHAGNREFYLEHGYQPKNAGMTIESNFQDWALAQMAVRLGLEDEAAYFGNRSHGWRKLYRPRLSSCSSPEDEQGQWLHDDPLRGTGWIEANAWQATWGVSHELPTSQRSWGGYDKLCEKPQLCIRSRSCAAGFRVRLRTRLRQLRQPAGMLQRTRIQLGRGNPGSRNTGFAG